MALQANKVAVGSEPSAPTVATALRGFRRPLWLGLALITTVGVIGWLLPRLQGTVSTGRPLPVFAQVPDFSLTERDGRRVRRGDLLGHVWVADFIFTACTGPCPELTLRLRSLQSSLGKADLGVKLVSFTLDPETDTPAVLRRYAKRYHADPDRWWFLTGDGQERMHKLVQEGFLQAVSPASNGRPLIHSTRFVLVDQQGRIRAWYDGLDPKSKPLILRDIESLLNEPTG